MNHAAILEALATAYPDRECLVQREVRRTYAQVTERARRLASVLHAHGLGCHRERAALANHESGQDHLAIYLTNGPEFLETMLGCYRARVAPFNVNYRYVEDELAYLFTDARATAVVYHARFASTLAKIRARLPALRLLLQVADDSGHALLPGAFDFEHALATGDPAGPAVALSPDDLYILYTGGTTGAPKGVLWRQEDVFLSAMSGRGTGQPKPATLHEIVASAQRPGMRVMPSAPFMHGAAQWGAFSTFNQGGTVVMQSNVHRLDPDDVWGTIERERVNMLTIVGDAFARPLLEGLAGRSYDLSRFKVLFSGGAILSAHVKHAFLERIPHLTVLDGFGSSETGAHGTASTRREDKAQTGSFAMTDSVLLRDDFSGLLAPGSAETGWLARSGHVPLGYYGDVAKTARTFPVVHGVRYAAPGDHARYDATGSIEVLGRGAVCINSGGEKIYPEEVEETLKRHPAVFDATVVGTPDERFGEQVTAVIERRPGMEVTHEELVTFSGQYLARYKLPKTTVMVDRIVRSPSGKPDYRWAKATAMTARGLTPA